MFSKWLPAIKLWKEVALRHSVQHGSSNIVNSSGIDQSGNSEHFKHEASTKASSDSLAAEGAQIFTRFHAAVNDWRHVNPSARIAGRVQTPRTDSNTATSHPPFTVLWDPYSNETQGPSLDPSFTRVIYPNSYIHAANISFAGLQNQIPLKNVNIEVYSSLPTVSGALDTVSAGVHAASYPTFSGWKSMAHEIYILFIIQF